MKKKTVNVALSVKELLFDVMNKTYLTGVSRMAAGTSNFEAGSHMQASSDEEHSYQIRRSLSNAFSKLKVELGEYLSEDGSTTDNLIAAEIDKIDKEWVQINEIYTALDALTSQEKTKVAVLMTTCNDASASMDDVLDKYNEFMNSDAQANLKAKVTDIMKAAEPKLELSFILPSNFNPASCDALGDGLHEYMVASATGDWFTITNKADASDYMTLAQNALASVKRALYKRERPQRPVY